MTITTERLLLRPWREEDAVKLYEFSKDPEVGPACGWEPHSSVEHSRNILHDVLINDDTWAITIKPDDIGVGSLGIFPTEFEAGKGEPEIGYWIAKPYWGYGYMPEAVEAMLAMLFAAGHERVWCSHFEENEKSRRVIEKCGFTYQGSSVWHAQTGVDKKARWYCITKEKFDD